MVIAAVWVGVPMSSSAMIVIGLIALLGFAAWAVHYTVADKREKRRIASLSGPARERAQKARERRRHDEAMHRLGLPDTWEVEWAAYQRASAEWERNQRERDCPHCFSRVDRRASVCPACRGELTYEPPSSTPRPMPPMP